MPQKDFSYGFFGGGEVDIRVIIRQIFGQNAQMKRARAGKGLKET
jgi:hypothetical protein